MYYIEMHGHMVSRTTDDYREMAMAGCVAISEPAFWAGWDRQSADSFEDYFRQLTEFEPKRAAQFFIRHASWLCLNPKEGEDRRLTAQVLKRIPKFLDRPSVVGIGEIGMNRVTRNEVDTFTDHVRLALDYNQMMLIHTPHLEDKYKGTRVTIDNLLKFRNLEPRRVLIDHAEEHTIGMILEQGFYTGLTLYPNTKVSLARAVDMIEKYGPDRITISSACDWGPSVPTAVPQLMLEMRRRGHSEELIRKLVFENPLEFLMQSGKFELPRLGIPKALSHTAPGA
ncbi:MAG TPA: TatD family hydrolase [Bryobacteraceae bacterium]|nr:TatD family hydrolase [Bryobacteraceae bacterium]